MNSPKPLVRVAVLAGQSSLSKAQKSFNGLVKKIERQRDLLLQWQAADLICQQKIHQDLRPAKRVMDAQAAATVRALDQALGPFADTKSLTKSERKVVAQIICELAGDLVIASGDEALKAIYDKHSQHSFDAQSAADAAGLKNVMQDVFGLDLGGEGDGDGAASPADLFDKIKLEMDKAQIWEFEEQDRRSQRKKTPEQTAKAQAKAELADARAKAEAAQASQSIREVYRKLASALHPDRETDPLERERKTVLMQKVNQAYDKKNLLLLLELQLELEHIDARSIAGLPEQRLKNFNKILKEQLEEIEQEIADVEMPLRGQMGLSPFQPFMPQMVVPLLQRDIALMGQRTRQLKAELVIFKTPSQFKIWISQRRKALKQRDSETDDDDFPLYGQRG